jgi:hypothetical protein
VLNITKGLHPSLFTSFNHDRHLAGYCQPVTPIDRRPSWQTTSAVTLREHVPVGSAKIAVDELGRSMLGDAEVKVRGKGAFVEIAAVVDDARPAPYQPPCCVQEVIDKARCD